VGFLVRPPTLARSPACPCAGARSARPCILGSGRGWRCAADPLDGPDPKAMSDDSRAKVPRVPGGLADNDPATLDALIDLLYEELRLVAHQQRRRWRGDDTLGTTAPGRAARAALAMPAAARVDVDAGQDKLLGARGRRHQDQHHGAQSWANLCPHVVVFQFEGSAASSGRLTRHVGKTTPSPATRFPSAVRDANVIFGRTS
jgi:hypothetical protein